VSKGFETCYKSQKHVSHSKNMMTLMLRSTQVTSGLLSKGCRLR